MNAAARIVVGDGPAPRTVGPLEVAHFVRYSGASGDFNPLHYDVEHARAAGFPSPFAQGMFSAGVLGSFVADWLGPDAIRRFQVRFLAVVALGDTVTCTAAVTRAYVEDGERLVDLELGCARRDGSAAIAGSATCVVDASRRAQRQGREGGREGIEDYLTIRYAAVA